MDLFPSLTDFINKIVVLKLPGHMPEVIRNADVHQAVAGLQYKATNDARIHHGFQFDVRRVAVELAELGLLILVLRTPVVVQVTADGVGQYRLVYRLTDARNRASLNALVADLNSPDDHHPGA